MAKPDKITPEFVAAVLIELDNAGAKVGAAGAWADAPPVGKEFVAAVREATRRLDRATVAAVDADPEPAPGRLHERACALRRLVDENFDAAWSTVFTPDS